MSKTKMSTKNKCRACLEESLSTDSIFELNLSLNKKTTSFVECFFKCTSIQLNEDDVSLPQTMCESCVQSIINMYQFRLMCESTELQLKPKKAKKDIWDAEYLYNVPKLCKEPFFYEMEEDELDEEEEVAEKMEADVIEEPEHEAMDEGSLCFSEELDEDDELEETPEVKEIEKKPVERIKIKCRQCKGLYFRKKSLYFQHKLTEHNKMVCIDCPKEYTTKEKDLFQEHSKMHKSEYNQNCGVCKETFQTAIQIKKHDCRRVLKVLQSKSNGFHPCKHCERKFLNEIALNLHTRKHSNLPLHEDEKEEYTCTDCNLSFKTKNEFADHTRIAHDIPIRKLINSKNSLKGSSHLCPICGESFKTSCYVKVHMRIHTDDRPYRCTLCDKGFRQSTDLRYHTISFHGEKKHQCQLCDKKFVLPTNLKTHMRTHNNDRPFKCDLCDKSFTTSSGLAKHRNGVHLMSMRTCEVCGVEISVTQFRIHMSKHTGVYTHNCKLCDYKTNRKYLMTIHSEKRHSNVKLIETDGVDVLEII